jgi:hypothetical protein
MRMFLSALGERQGTATGGHGFVAWHASGLHGSGTKIERLGAKLPKLGIGEQVTELVRKALAGCELWRSLAPRARGKKTAALNFRGANSFQPGAFAGRSLEAGRSQAGAWERGNGWPRSLTQRHRGTERRVGMPSPSSVPPCLGVSFLVPAKHWEGRHNATPQHSGARRVRLCPRQPARSRRNMVTNRATAQHGVARYGGSQLVGRQTVRNWHAEKTAPEKSSKVARGRCCTRGLPSRGRIFCTGHSRGFFASYSEC